MINQYRVDCYWCGSIYVNAESAKDARYMVDQLNWQETLQLMLNNPDGIQEHIEVEKV